MSKMAKIKAMLTAAMMLTAVTAAYGENLIAAAKTAPDPLDGTYLIRNVNSGLYLDAAEAAGGANVFQHSTDEGTADVVWRLEYAADGHYYIYSMLDGGNTYVLSLEGNTDENNICISENAGLDSQLFYPSANSDGSYKLLIQSTDDTQGVEVINAYTTDDANVQKWEINGATCQDWELIPIDYVDYTDLTESNVTVTGGIDYIAGDINNDGKINVFDLVLSKRTYTENSLTEYKSYACDVNGDESFTLSDISELKNFLLTGKGTFVNRDTGAIRTYAGIDGAYTQGVSETTNTGYVSDAYLNLDNAADISAIWTVSAPRDGVYAVTMRYANGGTADRSMAVTLNNEIVYWTLQGAVTGSWTQWEEETIYLPLKEGLNQLTLTSLTSDGAPNIDYIAITSSEESESDSLPLEAIVGIPNVSASDREMEDLDRGVIAAYTGSGMLVSWRTLSSDSENTTFKLYQNGSLVTEIGAEDATCYLVAGATASDSFTVDTYVNGKMTEFANEATILGTKNSGQSGAYMDIALNVPADQTMPDGSTCSYTPNDCSVGDVDGDGEYEIILKWDPSNSQDNANTGYTGTVILDCYKLDGTQLWRIDLGVNIRAGAHYTQFMVYDFDGDGKAEMMCKTSDGTTDGQGNVIGNASADYRTSSGTILTGNEYLTLFDGLTGAELDTIDYEPERGDCTSSTAKTTWGDNYGNRSERYLAAVAYLDGQTPSAIFCRGYYTRTAVVAYDIVDKKIVKRWSYDTGFNSNDPAYGQGNHSVVVMDVDEDGKDELIYGSCCFDDDGSLLWSTGLGHGDCMQAGDLIPEREGLEVFQVHEEVYCAEIHDAATGEILWRVDGTGDVGRGIALNMSADTAGMEFASTADGLVYSYNTSTGQIEATGYAWNDRIKWSINSAVWWDGDLERNTLDRTMVEEPSESGAVRLFTGDGVTYNNSSKSNACLTCDLFGDWREEMIFATSDGSALRIFTTTYDTDIKLTTLMHDSQYRTGVAIENVGYNQAPNTSFFLGTGYDLP